MRSFLLIGLLLLNAIQYVPSPSSALPTASDAAPNPCCVPILTDLRGNVVASNLTAGAQYVIHVTATNYNPSSDMNATILVDVRDSNGTTTWLDWQTQTIRPNETVESGMSWMPQYPEIYHLKVFVLSNLTSPQLLAPTITADALVG